MTPVEPTVPRAQHRSGWFQILWRRKFVVLVCAIAVPLTAIVVSEQQQKLYQASSQVFLKRQNLAATLTGGVDSSINQPDDRIVQTQADLARAPAVLSAALAQAHVSPAEKSRLVKEVSVTPKANADFLVFSITSPDPKVAQTIVNAYARAYTDYRRQVDTNATKQALLEVRNRLAGVRAKSPRSRGLESALISKEQQLQTIQALQTSNAFVTNQASKATLVQPTPVRNAALGAVIGLLLGIGLALLLDRLDTRVRSEAELSDELGVPLLGRLAPPPSKRDAYTLAPLEDSTSPHAEAISMVSVAIELAQVDREIRTVIVTSAVAGEGKSTTVANVAVALARGGKRVRVVDLDLRRPTLDRFFGVASSTGLTDVVRGRAYLRDAVIEIPVTANSNGNGSDALLDSSGRLEILPTGILPPAPSDLIRTEKFGRVLQALRADADIVLIDAPPMLPVSDALTASANVDAMLLVVRMDTIRRPQLEELSRLVSSSPAPVIGYVATGVDADDELAGYAGYYGTESKASNLRAAEELSEPAEAVVAEDRS